MSLTLTWSVIRIGTCEESLRGGNHFRYWIQATSGAYFLAVSVEQNAAAAHNIVRPDGYDLGRDWLVGNATLGTTSPMTGTSYTTSATLLSGYLNPGSVGINHGISVDGKIAVLTVGVAAGQRRLGKRATRREVVLV